MREAYGDLWRLAADNGGVLVLTTNGTVKKDGTAVMGRGIALEATQRFPSIASDLGYALQTFGNRTHFWYAYDPPLITMPVKHNWWEKADVDLIVRSAREMLTLVDPAYEKVWMPRPGCGFGSLRWEDVKPLLDPILDDRFVAVTK